MSHSIDAVIKHMINQNNHNLKIAFPAIIINVDKLSDGFVDVQPIVNYTNPLTLESVPYPVINDVRLVFPSTQNSTISFPVNQGDFVDLLVQSVDIQKFVAGNTEKHDPDLLSYGNLTNVVAYVGFTPYQQSCFNPNNYKNDFNNQDLNIVHNKNTESEAIISVNTDGGIRLKSPTKVIVESPRVSYECNEFEINASEKIKFTSPLISENGR